MDDRWKDRNAWWLAPLVGVFFVPLAFGGAVQIGDDGWHWWANRAFALVLVASIVAVSFEAWRERHSNQRD